MLCSLDDSLIFIDVLIKNFHRLGYLSSACNYAVILRSDGSSFHSKFKSASKNNETAFAINCSYPSALRFGSTKSRWFYRKQCNHKVQHTAICEGICESDVMARRADAQHLPELRRRWVDSISNWEELIHITFDARSHDKVFLCPHLDLLISTFKILIFIQKWEMKNFLLESFVRWKIYVRKKGTRKSIRIYPITLMFMNF